MSCPTPPAWSGVSPTEPTTLPSDADPGESLCDGACLPPGSDTCVETVDSNGDPLYLRFSGGTLVSANDVPCSEPGWPGPCDSCSDYFCLVIPEALVAEFGFETVTLARSGDCAWSSCVTGTPYGDICFTLSNDGSYGDATWRLVCWGPDDPYFPYNVTYTWPSAAYACSGSITLNIAGGGPGSSVWPDTITLAQGPCVPDDVSPCDSTGCSDIYCLQIPGFMEPCELTRVTPCQWVGRIYCLGDPDSAGQEISLDLLATDGGPTVWAMLSFSIYQFVGTVTDCNVEFTLPRTAGTTPMCSVELGVPDSATITPGPCAGVTSCTICGHWPLTEVSVGNDISGNANHMTATLPIWSPDTPGPVAGPYGSLEMDSSLTSQMSAASAAGLPTADADRSVMIWAKFSDTDINSYLFAEYGIADAFALSLYYNGVNTQVFSDGTQTAVIAGDQRGTAGVWHHYAITYSAGALKFYRDGTLISTGTLSIALTTAGASVGVNHGVAAGKYIRVKDFRIYDCALTDSEVANVYTGGDPFTGLSQTVDIDLSIKDITTTSDIVASVDVVDIDATVNAITATAESGVGAVAVNVTINDITTSTGPTTWTFTSSQQFTVTVEGNHTLEAWGGGGGGGGGDSGVGGDGGGAGEYASETVYLYVGDVLDIVINSGGAGGAAGFSGVGGNGAGISSYSGTSFTAVTAAGGSGGAPAGLGTAGAGGTGSTNTVHTDGGNGATGDGTTGGGGGSQGSYTGGPGGTGSSTGSTAATVAGGGGGGPSNGTGGDGGNAIAKITGPP